jgi:hypothetical protein
VTGSPVFHFVQAPTHAEIEKLVAVIGQRVCKTLRRRGLLGQANHESNEAEKSDAAIDGCRRVAVSRGRFERIDEHGRAQQELFTELMARLASLVAPPRLPLTRLPECIHARFAACLQRKRTPSVHRRLDRGRLPAQRGIQAPQ